MRLQRYNEVLLAVAGTVFVLGAIVLAATIGTNLFWRGGEKGLVVPRDSGNREPQRLVFCSPLFVLGSDFQYFPVAVVSSEDASKTPGLAAQYSRVLSQPRRTFFTGCGLEYPSDNSRMFNVVIRDTRSGKEHLLLDSPGQIESLHLPDEKCSEGLGDAPCNTLIWNIRKVDSNGDGLLNGEDALVAYLSDLSADSLRAVTPLEATVLSTSWDARSGEILFQVRRDTNNDRKFTAEDGAEVLAASAEDTGPARTVIDASIMKILEEAVR